MTHESENIDTIINIRELERVLSGNNISRYTRKLPKKYRESVNTLNKLVSFWREKYDSKNKLVTFVVPTDYVEDFTTTTLNLLDYYINLSKSKENGK